MKWILYSRIIGRRLLHHSPATALYTNHVSKDCFRMKSYYVTTPIYYVNSVPHIGHLYTTTLADATCRWHNFRQENNSAKMLTGTDEHGSKVMQAAHREGFDTLQYCDKVSKRFQDMCETFGINCFDFIRTTEERHQTAVQHFWKTIADNGYIYKGVYEGWYSTSDETFVPESNIVLQTDKQTGETLHMCKETSNRLEWTKENNYMFKLSELTDQVHQWILNNPNVIYPERFRKLILKYLEERPADLSVSRESSRVPWGIPVPDDPTQTVYVWLDALINYLTAAGYPDTNRVEFREMWPADIHFVGFDIVKFHAIYWPAFLIAAGLELPKQIVVHSHWTYAQSKMSKSKGNVVDPFNMANKVTAEGLKFFLLRQSCLENNCSYSDLLLYRVLNSDLANDLGNVLHRGTAKALNPSQTYPAFHKQVFQRNSEYCQISEDFSLAITEEFISQVRKLPSVVEEHALKLQYCDLIFDIMEVVRRSNYVIHHYRLWTLDKENEKQLQLLETLLHCVYEGLRVSAILLQPIAPQLADKALCKLGIPESSRCWRDAIASFLELDGVKEPLIGKPVGGDKKVLFKKLQIPDHMLKEEQGRTVP